MNLKEFNKINVPCATRKGIPYISLNSVSGVINISSAAVGLLGINVGDQVAFLQDEEVSKNWFLATSAQGFPVRKNGNSGNLCFGNHVMVDKILTSLNVLDKSVRINITSEPIKDLSREVYALITAPVINKGRPTETKPSLAPKRF